MSGGQFNYIQYRIDDIADEMADEIQCNDMEFSSETIDKFKLAMETLRSAAIMVQRIDWLLSYDDGEETFHKRWAEDFAKLKKSKP